MIIEDGEEEDDAGNLGMTVVEEGAEDVEDDLG